jgi:hypothetical protein
MDPPKKDTAIIYNFQCIDESYFSQARILVFNVMPKKTFAISGHI